MNRFPFVRLVLGCLGLSVAIAAGQDARERYYAWPPTEHFPHANGEEFWDWSVGEPSAQPVLLDLRPLNEKVAGQDGWVTSRGDKLYLGNGQPVRFWAVNTTGDAPLEQLILLANTLAQRGVNMIRIHGGASKSLLDFKADRLDAVNRDVIDQMHKAVVAAKQAGIYTFASNQFFIIEYKVKASHGLAGYTQAWLDQNPDKHVPFGLIFLNDTFRQAYKGWLREFVTAPNPYDPKRTPLAKDPAVAVMEILNEENHFFWTFRPDWWPAEQRALVGGKFFGWVAQRYRKPGDAGDAAAVQRALDAWQYPLPEDAPAEGRLAVLGSARFGHDQAGAKRIADQLAFLHETQRGFFEEMTAMLRELGYQGLVSPSNWATANDSVLLDLEHETYRAGGLIDRHAYYPPVVEKPAAETWRLSVGDVFLPFSATATPAAASFNVRQTAGHPSAMSEFSWVNYNPAGAEAAVMAAAYFALTDFDLPVWFALPNNAWGDRTPKWPTGNPSTLGQFPGAALQFRRGDVAEAPVVVREGRTMAWLYAREPALIMPGRGYDPTRDSPANDGAKAPKQGAAKDAKRRESVGEDARDVREIDPLAMLTGKVEVAYGASDADEVSPKLKELIDRKQGRVTSITGEVAMDWRNGLSTINTARSQGLAGFLRANGRVECRDVVFQSQNTMGALLAIALDDRPLAKARRILLQAGTVDRPTGFRTSPVKLAYQGRDYAGHRIESLGRMPWQVENVAATVTLKGQAKRVSAVLALDPSGRLRARITGTARGEDYEIRLPADTLYTIVELGE